MDAVFLVALILTVVAAAVVWKLLQGKKPEIDIIAAHGSPSKRKPKKKTAPKKHENTKWDAQEKEEKVEKDGKVVRRKTKDTDKAYDPIAAGKAMVNAAQQSTKEEDSKKQLSDRQKNRLQAQGFVSVDTKKAGGKRSASENSVGPADEDDDDDQYSGMSADAAERLKLLERIASGKRIGPDDGTFGDRDRKKQGGIGQERRVDHDIVRQRLDEQKREREEAVAAKTKTRGGVVAFQGAGVKKPITQNAWARAAPAAPAADASVPESVELPASPRSDDQ